MDKNRVQEPTEDQQRTRLNITSETVKNAHASGDGSVQKSDELLPAEDEKPEREQDDSY